VARTGNVSDGRSTLASLTPSIQAWATEALAPLVDEIDAIIAELSASERAILVRAPERIAEAAEQHADRISRNANEASRDARAVALSPL
jgi:DNA-binding MarR family transcriptional regulator